MNITSTASVLLRVAMFAIVTLAVPTLAAHGAAPILFSDTAELGGVPFSPQTPRLWHKTAGYGQEDSHTAVGGRVTGQILSDGILFIDGQFKMADSDQFGVNMGGGARWFYEGLLVGSDRIFGASFWYDGEETPFDNYFNQVGVSFETMGDRIDARLNANFPTDNDRVTESVTAASVRRFAGNLLIQDALTTFEVPLTVVDYEVAVRAFQTQVWAYGGGYTLDGTGISTSGYKIGARGYVTDDLVVDLSVSDDDEFGTNTLFSIIWFPGRATSSGGGCVRGFDRRIQEPVYRNNYVALQREGRLGTNALADDDGDPFTFVHVDSSAAAPGDGTFEAPLASINDVAANSAPGNIVLVHADSTFTGESVSLQDEQRLLGEGGGEQHVLTTSILGELPIPETAPGAQSAAIPQINNAPGDAVVLTPSGDPTRLEAIEVSNLAIDGGTRGVAAPGGAGNVNVNRVTIANTTSHGIELTPLVESLGTGDTQVRITPTIDRVTFDNIGGDDVLIDASHGEPASSQLIESIFVTDVTSTNAQGDGVNLANVSNAGVFNYNYDGGGSGAAGIRFTDSTGQLFVQDADVTAGTGPGIAIEGGDATITFTRANVTDTGDAAVLVDGGAVDATFSGGVIAQGANQDALRVAGGHTGTLTFNADGDGNGRLEATNGDGLQFDDADGTYTFNHRVELNGGNAGIDLAAPSAGTVNLGDALINNPAGVAVDVAGGAGNLNYTGEIIRTAGTNVTTLRVDGSHSGTLSFNNPATGGNPSFAVADGDGLQFVNADGTYNFNGRVELDGGDAGIDILAASAGDVTFADALIDDPTGAAVNVAGGSGNLTYTGEIVRTTNASVLTVSGGHTGTLAFNDPASSGNPSINATGGDGLQFSNADGVYTFNGEVQLNGGDAGIDLLAGSDGVFTFQNAQITNPTGRGLNVVGGDASVTFTGQIAQSNAASAINVSGGHDGTLVFNEGTAGPGVVNATGGDGVQFNNADGAYTFNDGVTLNGGDAGIDITGGSEGTFVFDADSAITNPTGDALVVNGSEAIVTYQGSIADDTGRAVRIENNTGGDVILTGAVDATDEGIIVQNNTGGNFRFTGAATLNTGANDAVTVDNNSGGSTRFDNLTIATTTGDGFTSSGSDAVAVSGATNTITTAGGVGLNLNNVVVGPVGVSFQSVSADGGASGIVLNNVTGGLVSVGAGGANVADGGVILNSTGAGVSATNVENLSLNNLSVSLTAAEGVRIDMNNATPGNITLNNNSVTNASGSEALLLTASGATPKQVNVLVQNNIFSNDDPTATAADFQTNGDVAMNLTVTANTFTNVDAATGRPMEVVANNANAVVQLDLNGNTATAGNGGDDYFLEQAAGTFNAVDQPNLNANNTGQVNETGTINDIPGPIPTP